MSQYVDPLDAATAAGNRLDAYFGRIEVSASYVKLEKGIGKTPWSETDGQDARRTEVHLVLNPIEASGLTFLVERKLIAESNEWSKTVWSSCRELGLKSVRDLHGRYVKVEMVKTGRTYTKRDGTTGEESTLHFAAIFDDLAACEAAYWAERGGKPQAGAEAIEMGPQDGAPRNGATPPVTVARTVASNGSNGATPASEAERAVAKQFLDVLVKQAHGDLSVLAGLIASMPLVNKYFAVTSPEVVELLTVTA